ncbi:MAG: Na-K-Cl cotransporter [Geothermobacteraceae bacterium]
MPVFQSRAPAGRGRLGTFIGVYTPTILTILGVIMYLRFGWVLGQVGLTRTLLIVLLANAITLATSLALAAIATNIRVGAGGAYYILSRSLGIEIGGAIGVPLFLSQVLSVTLYAYGLAESLRILWPGIPVEAAAFIIILAVGGLAFKGAGFALKAQLPIMGFIALSLVALAVGALQPGLVPAPDPAPAIAPAGFWQVFAVFFPAVTGIMAGLGLSGDLKDPRTAIPRGTLAAVATGLIVYLLVPLLLQAGADRTLLLTEPMAWTHIAVGGAWLILPGLWGAIFSSAVGSILGAPRTLQALADDRLAPARFARKGDGEPVPGLILSVILTLLAVLLGDLNTVATVVTMFFLTVYGSINLVAAFESLSGNPSWRPLIRVPWWLSLLGAMGCFGSMLLISPVATLIAIGTEILLWSLIKRRERRRRHASLWRDLFQALIRWALFQLQKHPVTARNWRPHILVFVGDVERRLDLARYGAWFSENRGMVTVCEMHQGNLLDMKLDVRARQKQINELLHREGIPAYGEVHVVPRVETGLIAVAQANGMAELQSNTVLVGWPDERKRLVTFLRAIRSLHRLNKSLLIGKVHDPAPLPEGEHRSIHIWWGGLQRNGDLMLLLAYLLERNPEWRHAEIRILSVASNPVMQRQTHQFLDQLLDEIRIDAEVSVMLRPEGKKIRDLMREASAEADLVLLGLAAPEEGEEEAAADRLYELTEGLDSFILVSNGSLFVGDLVTPEAVEIEDDAVPDDKPQPPTEATTPNSASQPTTRSTSS